MKIIKTPSPNFSERQLTVDSILIHYTDMVTVEGALAWLSNPFSKVSSHYLIDEKGQIYQLIQEDKRAWHAGESYWQGCTDLNSCSIGIELANPGHSHGYVPFPEAQIDSLLRLCEDICTRWVIPASRILGHSDIAPRRKQDPGHLFPWGTLAREGLGLWPLLPHQLKQKAWIASGFRPRNDGAGGVLSSPIRHCEALQEPKQSREVSLEAIAIESLEKIGYETVSPTHTLLAFQRHFQPHKMDGIADQETLSLLYGLLKIF